MGTCVSGISLWGGLNSGQPFDTEADQGYSVTYTLFKQEFRNEDHYFQGGSHE
jgi:hypothetical protein